MRRALIAAIMIAAAIAAVVAGILLYLPASPLPAPAATAPAATTPTDAPVGRFVALPGADFAQVAPLDGKGQPADMSAYKGKKLLVNLWATWCAPCIEELPSLAKLQEDAGGADFAVVTIAIDERDPAKIEPFLKEHGAGNLPALIDTNRTIDKITKVIALPTSLLVERDGQVKAMLTGDARWHCGISLEVVKAFIADGSVREEELATECD